MLVVNNMEWRNMLISGLIQIRIISNQGDQHFELMYIFKKKLVVSNIRKTINEKKLPGKAVYWSAAALFVAQVASSNLRFFSWVFPFSSNLNFISTTFIRLLVTLQIPKKGGCCIRAQFAHFKFSYYIWIIEKQMLNISSDYRPDQVSVYWDGKGAKIKHQTW